MADDNKPGATAGTAGRTPQQTSDKRAALREQFSDGKIPTGEHFGNLIDAFVLTDALEGDQGVLQRLDDLEEPKDGRFLESVAIGDGGGRWTISADTDGSLEFRPETGNPGGWVRMPARIGSFSRDTDADKLPAIDSLDLQPNHLSGRDFSLTSPRPGPFAVEVMATVEPDEDDPDGQDRNFLSRLWNGLLRPPGGPAMIRAVAVSAGGGTPPDVRYHATPLARRRVALTRTVTEFVLVALAVFFLSDKINSEIQQISPQDDWFEKSFTLSVPEKLFCPVMPLLAKARIYTLPKGACEDQGGEAAQADGDGGKASDGGGQPDSGAASGSGSGSGSTGPGSTSGNGAKTDFNPSDNWLAELTGQAPPAAPAGNQGASGNTSSGSTASGGAGAGNAPAGGSGSQAASPAGGGGGQQAAKPAVADPSQPADKEIALKTAYSVAGLAALALLLWLWLRTIPMWQAMRASLSVEWISDAKAPGGLTLMLRRRGLLATPTAKVRYHMTQLWG